MKDRFRFFKGFVFLILFLPVLVMGEECHYEASPSGWTESLDAQIKMLPNESDTIVDYACLDIQAISGFQEDGTIRVTLDDEKVAITRDPLVSSTKTVISYTSTESQFKACFVIEGKENSTVSVRHRMTESFTTNYIDWTITKKCTTPPPPPPPTPTVSISSITPNTVKLNERTTFTVHGTNLPSDLALDIVDFDNIVQSGGSATELEFYATPTAIGVKNATMRDEAGGAILKTLSITVEEDSVSVTPIVSSVTPTTANFNENTTFTIAGTDLPDTLIMYIPDCENMTSLGGGTSSKQFSCTPINTAGLKSAEIKDKPSGTILKALGIDIIDNHSTYGLSIDVDDIGGATGQVASSPIGITNCRDNNQGTCNAEFREDVIITAYPQADSIVDFGTTQCTKIEGDSCTVSMDGDRAIKVNFKPKDDKIVLTLDAMPQSLKIHPNETIKLDFKVTENRDNMIYVLQMNLDDGKGAVNCKNNFSMKDIVTCEASYTSAGNYTLTATAYADSDMNIRSNMLSIPIEISTATDDSKYTGHQNQEHLKQFWTNNPTTAKEAFIVDTATGTQNLNLSFMAQSGQLDLAFGITYNSGLAKNSQKGILGQGWSHSYGALAHIEEIDNNTLILHTSSSRQTTFIKGDDGIYISANRPRGILPNYYDKITKEVNGYILENTNKTQRFFRADGKLERIINKRGEKLFLSHNEEGRLSRILEPISDIALNYTYNDDGSINQVSDDTGRVVSFHYSAGHLTSITDVDGTAHIFTNNDNGEMYIYKIENNSVSFNYFINVYDELGRVTKQRDGNGNDTTFTYDESSYAIIKTTVTTPLNNTRVYTYNSNYQLLEFIDELGYTTTNKYTTSGLLRSTSNPKGLITRYSYNDKGQTSKVESPNNSTVWHYYDEEANLIETTDELGYANIYTYEDNYLTKVERNVNGEVKALVTTEYTFGNFAYPDDTTTALVSQIETTTAKGNKSTQTFQFGHLVSSTTAENITSTYQYNNRGQLIQQILHAENGDYTSTFEYNTLGQITKATDPEGKIVSKTYSIFGTVSTLTDAMGNTLINNYDENGNLVKSTAPNSVVTKYEYNPNNQLVNVEDANGHKSFIEYDNKGRKEFIKNHDGDLLANYKYDELDTVIETKLYDESGNATTASQIEYDIPTRYSKTISKLGKLEREVEQYLDSKGRVWKTLNPARDATRYTYENHFDTITEVEAYGEITQQTVDDEGNLKTLTDVIANTSKFDHDSQKDKTLEESALGKTHRTTYNSQYLVKTFTNARGQTRNFTYYKNGWLKSATSDGVVWSFEYDNNGNLLTMSSSEGTITRGYDVFNRVTSYTDQNGNTLGYAYDSVGNLLELTYPNGKKVKYTYDNSNHLKTVTDWNNVTLVTYSYTRQGKLLEELRANGSRRTYTYYKGIGELQSISDTKSDGSIIVSYSYEYDIKGNIIKETKTDDTKTTVFDYTYTPKGMLEKALINPREEIYNVSNLTMTHIGDNRADTIDSQAISYDEDGNMIKYMLKGKLTTLSYDEKSRLTSVGEVEHRYGIEDAKIETLKNGKSTKFVVDTNRKLSQLLVEKLPNGDEVYHIYGAGLVATLDKDGTHYYHYDYRGSTVALTDSNEKITDRYVYLPFGKMINHSLGHSKTRFLYVGKYGIEREASGLYYMRARYYDADIKRFISKDNLIGSVGDGLSLNRYLYANGNPIGFIDLLGKSGEEVSTFYDNPFGGKQVELDIKVDPNSNHDLGQISCAYGYIGAKCDVDMGYAYTNPDSLLNGGGYIVNKQIIGIVDTQDKNYEYSEIGVLWAPIGAKGQGGFNFMGFHFGAKVEANLGVGASTKVGVSKFDEEKYGLHLDLSLIFGIGGGVEANAHFDHKEFREDIKSVGNTISDVKKSVDKAGYSFYDNNQYYHSFIDWTIE